MRTYEIYTIYGPETRCSRIERMKKKCITKQHREQQYRHRRLTYTQM